ncbi:Uncharacterised protein [Candidatus Anstonella stagnisolia]|nr:Uncharacterised protein [Candidatus Anstonella stagnisolia]
MPGAQAPAPQKQLALNPRETPALSPGNNGSNSHKEPEFPLIEPISHERTNLLKAQKSGINSAWHEFLAEDRKSLDELGRIGEEILQLLQDGFLCDPNREHASNFFQSLRAVAEKANGDKRRSDLESLSRTLDSFMLQYEEAATLYKGTHYSAEDFGSLLDDDSDSVPVQLIQLSVKHFLERMDALNGNAEPKKDGCLFYSLNANLPIMAAIAAASTEKASQTTGLHPFAFRNFLIDAFCAIEEVHHINLMDASPRLLREIEKRHASPYFPHTLLSSL